MRAQIRDIIPFRFAGVPISCIDTPYRRFETDCFSGAIDKLLVLVRIIV